MARAISAGGSGWCGSGDGGTDSCWRWRRSERLLRVRTGAAVARAAVAQGTGCGARLAERLGKPGLGTAGEG